MYYIKKTLSLAVTILFITMAAFFLFSILPGDAAMVSLGTEATEESLKALREEMGLDKNPVERYTDWIGGALKGDFGNSTYYKIPVSELISERIQVTFLLAILTLILIILFSVPAAIIAAKFKGSLADRTILALCRILMAVPGFFLGIILIFVFGLILGIMDVGGYVSPYLDFSAFLQYMLYPALAIAIPKSAMVIRFLRGNILHEKDKDYVRTARAFGASENDVMYRHVLKNAMVSTITFLGVVAAEILAGSVIIEQVFGIPGLGRLLVSSVGVRDYNVLQAIMLYIGYTVVVVNFLVDVLYHLADPTIK